MNKQNRKRQRYREQTEGCHWEEGLVIGWKMVKGLISTNRQLQNSHWDVKYRMESSANNTVRTLHGAGRVQDFLGDHCGFYKCLTSVLYTKLISNVRYN